MLEYLAAVGRARISWIARFANLPLDRARRLLGEMAFYSLVEEVEEGGGRYYRISERGYEYLELWRRLRVLMGARAGEGFP